MPTTATSLTDLLAYPLGLADRWTFWKIEALRRRLLRSNEPIPIVDFGAGSHAEVNAGTPIQAGRQVTGTVGETCIMASKSETWGRRLYALIRATQPTYGIELGTCLGLSAAYQAAAMQRNGIGRFVTLEGAPALAELSRRHLSGLGLTNVDVRVGRFEDTLPAALNERVDYAFIDGHHDDAATRRYFDQITQAAKPGAILVFDDIEWSDGMKRAWQTIRQDRRVEQAMAVEGVGLTQLR